MRQVLAIYCRIRYPIIIIFGLGAILLPLVSFCVMVLCLASSTVFLSLAGPDQKDVIIKQGQCWLFNCLGFAITYGATTLSQHLALFNQPSFYETTLYIAPYLFLAATGLNILICIIALEVARREYIKQHGDI